jgi:hypothetical protein
LVCGRHSIMCYLHGHLSQAGAAFWVSLSCRRASCCRLSVHAVDSILSVCQVEAVLRSGSGGLVAAICPTCVWLYWLALCCAALGPFCAAAVPAAVVPVPPPGFEQKLR